MNDAPLAETERHVRPQDRAPSYKATCNVGESHSPTVHSDVSHDVSYSLADPSIYKSAPRRSQSQSLHSHVGRYTESASIQESSLQHAYHNATAHNVSDFQRGRRYSFWVGCSVVSAAIPINFLTRKKFERLQCSRPTQHYAARQRNHRSCN